MYHPYRQTNVKKEDDSSAESESEASNRDCLYRNINYRLRQSVWNNNVNESKSDFENGNDFEGTLTEKKSTEYPVNQPSGRSKNSQQDQSKNALNSPLFKSFEVTTSDLQTERLQCRKGATRVTWRERKYDIVEDNEYDGATETSTDKRNNFENGEEEKERADFVTSEANKLKIWETDDKNELGNIERKQQKKKKTATDRDLELIQYVILRKAKEKDVSII